MPRPASGRCAYQSRWTGNRHLATHSYAAKRLNSFRRSLLPQYLPKRVGVRLLLFKLKRESQYDLILDVAAYRSVFDYLPILKPTGSYVLIGGSTARFFQVMLFGTWISRISGRKVQCLASKPNQTDLVILRDLLKAGKIVPLIDRRFNLSEVPTAINYLEQRQVLGKVAILTSCINLV